MSDCFFLCNLDYLTQTTENKNVYWTWLGGYNISQVGPTFKWIDGSEGNFLTLYYVCFYSFYIITNL